MGIGDNFSGKLCCWDSGGPRCFCIRYGHTDRNDFY